MPLPEILDVVRATFHWNDQAGADNPVSVQHFHMAEGVTLDDLAAMIDSEVSEHQFEGLRDDCEATSLDLLPLDGTSPTRTFTLENWHGSSGSGDPLIGQAIMVEGQTGFRGPANRGRLFLPSPVEGVVTNGELDSANASEIADAWLEWQTAMQALGGEHVVASYVHVEAHIIESYKVPQKLGRIRRRQRG